MGRVDTSEPIAVVGGGLGGLSAAIHLRVAGRPVTIFEANERVGGRASLIERDGFRFDTGPSLLNYPWVFEDLFRAAGKKLSDYVTLLKVDPSVGFVWPDGSTFSLSSRLDALLAECERVEPGSGPALLAYLGDASVKYRVAFDKLVSRNADSALQWFGALSLREMAGLSVWRSLESELGRFFKSERIREALGSYGMYLGGSPQSLPGFFSILPYGELAYGLWLPKGGIYRLVEGMERLARELGVEIRTNSRVAAVRTGSGAIQGIALQTGEQLDFSTVISNVDVPTTNTCLLRSNGLAKKLAARAERTRMTAGVITYYWGVRGKVERLGHHTIFLPKDYRGAFEDLNVKKRIPRDLPFYVSLPSETDPDLAPHGDTAMFVLVPTPLISEARVSDWQAEAEHVKRRVLDRLARHGIALDASRIILEEVYTPETWRDRFGLYDGSAFGAAHNLFQVGPFRDPNYSRDITGLYYVGASTVPGTGMPMVVLSGKLVAERVLGHAR
ncbi:MAG: phytoene dehydrogenase [Candidatus Hydrogenedentota bacterium]